MTTTEQTAEASTPDGPRDDYPTTSPEPAAPPPSPAAEPAPPSPTQDPPADAPGVQGAAATEPSQDYRTEVQRLVDEGTPLTLSDGTKIELSPLRTREFLMLMRIATQGAGPYLAAQIQSARDAEEMAGSILGILMIAIPEAPDQTIDLIKALASIPADTPAAEAGTARGKLAILLNNPELEDMISILEGVLWRERDELMALGKRLAGAVKALASKPLLDTTRI